jgi:hypothetical protein
MKLNVVWQGAMRAPEQSRFWKRELRASVISLESTHAMVASATAFKSGTTIRGVGPGGSNPAALTIS